VTEEVLITSLLLLALAPVCALAADLKAQTSTRYIRYNDPFPDGTPRDFLRYVKAGPFSCPCFTGITTAAEPRASRIHRFVSNDPWTHAHN
jgi:hypothetical protein